MATNRLVQQGKVKVYATTMFNAANDAGGADKVVAVRNQMARLRHLIYADMDLTLALNDSSYTPRQRYDLAKAVFADCEVALCETLAVMAEQGDVSLLGQVYNAYEEEMAEQLKLCVVDVTTVVPLDDALRNLIGKKAEAELGCNAVLNESIDKSILGGIIMSVNGMRIDASVLSQLNRARYVLKGIDGGDSQ